MNTIIKIGILCLILTAVVLSGCVAPETDKTSNNTTEDEPASIITDMIDIVTDESTDLPIAAYMDTGAVRPYQFVLSTDGTAELCEVGGQADECIQGTWNSDGADEYVIIIEDFSDLYITILDDGVAEFRSGGDFIEGTWLPWNSKNAPKATSTKVVATPRPRSTVKPTPAPTADESEFVMEHPFLVSIEGTGIQEGVNFIVMIDDDGETWYHYTWCGMNIATAQEIALMDVTHYDDKIIYRGNDVNGMAMSITAYETERGGGRATQIGFDDDPDCVWNRWTNMPGVITGKITQYNQENFG